MNFHEIKAITTVLTVSALLPLLAYAEAGDGGLTLRDCLVYAREHSFANRLSSLDAAGAKTDTRLAASALMPSVRLTTSGSMSFGRNIDPETNIYDTNSTLSTGFGLSLSLPVFDGLVTVNRLREAAATGRRLAQHSRRVADEISLEVIKAFFNVCYCRVMVAQMEEQLLRDATDLRATMREVELGTKSGADETEMRAVVAADEYALSNQRSLLSKAFLELRSSMGMELTPDPLPLIDDNYEIASADAIDSHPEIAEAEIAIDESRYALRAARGAFWPAISFNAGISTSYFRMSGSRGADAPAFSRQWKDNMGQYFGLTFSLPLFDGLATLSRVKRARINLEASKTRLCEVRYEIARREACARLELTAAVEELTAARRRLDAEQTAYEVIRRKYELGGASAIDLYTSGARLATARANLEGKRIQLRINEITVAYYEGKSLIQD